MTTLRFSFFPFSSFVFALLFLSSCAQPSWQHDEGLVFGTVYSISYQFDDNLRSDIEAALKSVDDEFSMFNEHSTVARINRGEPVDSSAMFLEVWRLAQAVNRDTWGAFDITVAPLVNAWGFGFKHEQMPTPEQVDSLLQIRSQLDFSAIAKGYGSDVVGRLLASKGIQNYMVEIGGEVVTSGHNSRGEAWRIGVTKPTEAADAGGELQAILRVSGRAMATSGNYRNFYYKGGRRYAHTIDPRTGYPVQHNILSATVLADDCATADAYATAFMVLGLDSARQVLERHPELAAYFICSTEADSLTVWQSPQFSQYLNNE